MWAFKNKAPTGQREQQPSLSKIIIGPKEETFPGYDDNKTEESEQKRRIGGFT